MAFARGAAAVTKAVEEQSQSFGQRLSIFTWKDNNDKKILRFLEDDLPLVGDFAQMIQTTHETIQTMDFLIDPDGTNWVEYYGGKQREFGTGNLVTPRLRKMGVGIAVLRKEIPDPQNPNRYLVVDETQTIETKDGQKYEGLVYGIVKLPLGSFWKKLTGMQRRYGTLVDRDYEVIRRGAKGDKMTDYEVSAIDSTSEEMRDPDQVRARYGYGKKFDESNPDRFRYCPKTLDEWAEEYSGQERAKFFLEGGNGNGSKPVVVEGAQPLTKYSSPQPVTGSLGGSGWASPADDEAQPVASAASGFQSIRSKVLNHFDNHPAE